MRPYLEQFKKQVEEGLEIGRHFAAQVKKTHRPRRVLFWGMGGSAMSGEILQSLTASHSDIALRVHRNVSWPNWVDWVDKNTFIIFSSYSGNSKEVIEPAADPRVGNKNTLIVSSGGKIKHLAEKKKIPFLQIPSGMPPRCALGYLTFSVLPFLEKIGNFKVADAEIQDLLKVLGQDVRTDARRIAKKLFQRNIHLYGVSGFMEPAVKRLRAQLAENAKTLASHFLLPEMFHNEIEGWNKPASIIRRSIAVFLTDKADHLEIQKKRNAAIRHIRKQGGQTEIISSWGRYPIGRLFSLISLGDWISYELARLYHVDPVDIPTIDSLKRVG